MGARDRSPIDDGKAQVMAHQVVNATLGRSSIDKCLKASHSRHGLR
jgi:hypothetical protein